MFGATFNLVTRRAYVSTTLIFGTLKDCSLQINSFASLFQLQKHLSTWRQRYVKNGFETPNVFVIKLQISCSSDPTILLKFHQHVVQIFF